jgi:hypothetical protein
VRSEPTAHTLVLQVSMEALGDEFILTRIADEAYLPSLFNEAIQLYS